MVAAAGTSAGSIHSDSDLEAQFESQVEILSIEVATVVGQKKDLVAGFEVLKVVWQVVVGLTNPAARSGVPEASDEVVQLVDSVDSLLAEAMRYQESSLAGAERRIED